VLTQQQRSLDALVKQVMHQNGQAGNVQDAITGLGEDTMASVKTLVESTTTQFEQLTTVTKAQGDRTCHALAQQAKIMRDLVTEIVNVKQQQPPAKQSTTEGTLNGPTTANLNAIDLNITRPPTIDQQVSVSVTPNYTDAVFSSHITTTSDATTNTHPPSSPQVREDDDDGDRDEEGDPPQSSCQCPCRHPGFEYRDRPDESLARYVEAVTHDRKTGVTNLNQETEADRNRKQQIAAMDKDIEHTRSMLDGNTSPVHAMQNVAKIMYNTQRVEQMGLRRGPTQQRPDMRKTFVFRGGDGEDATAWIDEMRYQIVNGKLSQFHARQLVMMNVEDAAETHVNRLPREQQDTAEGILQAIQRRWNPVECMGEARQSFMTIRQQGNVRSFLEDLYNYRRRGWPHEDVETRNYAVYEQYLTATGT
jgi:hypothetical protein